MSYSPGSDWHQFPDDFVTGGTRWTDNGGTGSGQATTSLGASGGVVSWSVAGAGWINQTPFAFYDGASVDMSTFLPFDFEATLQRAFNDWATIANIEFIQVEDQGGDAGTAAFPTIRIFGGFIDGQNGSNVLARAYFPSGSATGGEMAFDSGNTNFFANENGFYLTALHEIGHALGLNHETTNLAIMNPSINTSLKGLQADDIAGLQTVYGNQDSGANEYFMAASQANMVMLDNAPNLTVFGNALDNMITGTAAAETIDGRGGKDTLISGGGGDTLIGGADDDTYFVRSGTIIVETAGGGTADIVRAAVSFTLAADDDIEKLTTTSGGGTSAINLTGNALKQDISGNAGANELSDGGAGAADTLRGLGGNDTYRIFNTGDKIVEDATSGTADKVVTAVSYALGTGVHVEMMQTSSGVGTSAINLYGNEFAQSLIAGNNGANRLEGKGGADTLRGLGGADTFAFATKLGGGNIDTIIDFNPTDDRFLLSDNIFTALSPGTLTAAAFRANTTGEARDATDRIVYDKDSGGIFYDADGLGGVAGVQFAIVSTGLSITNADFDVV